MLAILSLPILLLASQTPLKHHDVSSFRLHKIVQPMLAENEIGLMAQEPPLSLLSNEPIALKYHSKRLPSYQRQSRLLNEPVGPSYRDVNVPDIRDKPTVIGFARMTYDSYYEPDQSAWVPVDGWNISGKFGWEGSGIRGYVFVDEDEEKLIIVIKGTSLATPVGSGPTATRDKLNDNLMFSCCCAKAGWSWRAICDCPVSGSKCSNSCLLRESNFDDSYYNLAQTIYLAVKEWFPKHTSIWMTGHSLGGALASLVALTNDLASVAFEAPGDLMYASRLGLLPEVDDPTEYLDSLPIYHFGNDGDPIFLGECTGVSSSCFWLNYAIETKCHIGHECITMK